MPTASNGRWKGRTRLQWAPTLTAHDPNPPIPLEGVSVDPETVDTELSARRQRSAAFLVLSTGVSVGPPTGRYVHLLLLGVR
jgi:hypothetical protein